MEYELPLIYFLTVYAVTSFGILANLAVVISSGLLLKARFKPKVSYLLLGNVALADAISSSFMLVGTSVVHFKKKWYWLVCSTFTGFLVCCVITSMLTICLIVIDRFLYIIYCIQYPKLINSTRIRMLLVCTWIISFSLTFIPINVWFQYKGEMLEHCWVLIASHPILMQFWGTAAFVITVMELIIIIKIYSIILKTKLIMKQRFVVRPKCKTVLFLIYCCCSQLFTWSPFLSSIAVYLMFCDSPKNIPESWETPCEKFLILIWEPIFYLSLISILANPFIYAWWHKPFNIAVRRLFCGTKLPSSIYF